MKKTTRIRVIASLLQATPPLIVLFANYEIFVEGSARTISLFAMLVIVVLGLIFKDFIKDFYKIPTSFKIFTVIALLSYLGMTLGGMMLQLSVSALIGSGISTPLLMWKKGLETKKDDEILDTLKRLVKDDETTKF